jgi:hypothetical protein
MNNRKYNLLRFLGKLGVDTASKRVENTFSFEDITALLGSVTFDMKNIREWSKVNLKDDK